MRRVLTYIGVVTAVLVLLWLIWQTKNALLIIFAGILLGVFLSGVSGWISQHVPVPYKLALLLVVLFLLGGLVLVGWMAAPNLAQQVDQLGQSLSNAVQDLSQRLRQYEWGQALLAQAPSSVNEVVSSQQDLLSQVTGLFSRTLSVITNFVLILFVGLYLAISPDLYVGGLVSLVPLGRRQRVRDVIQAVGHTLRWWLVGRIFSMTVIGVLSVLGLWLIGVPLAFVLGLLAGLLGFIPILGPILALVPPLLLALSNSPQQGLYVILLYAGIQIVETYFLTPMVQQRAVSLPPVLTISSQLILGLLFGFMGIAMAPPLAAMGMVLVQMLYVEDTLGDRSVEVEGESDD